MKIYVSHSRCFDYLNELYKPIRESGLNSKFQFFLPHEDNRSINTKGVIKDSNLILAEVSFPTTGQGIELGWAEMLNVPILCIHREGAKISGSLKYITDKLITYTNKKEMISKLADYLLKIRM